MAAAAAFFSAAVGGQAPDQPDPLPNEPAQWQLPTGIPMPPFGLAERAPSAPRPWVEPVPGFYYVNASAGGATDAGNPYGTPFMPRQTIPTQLPAGSVVELHGTYRMSHGSPRGIVSLGSAERPVFIRGASWEQRPRVTGCWEVSGSYFVIELIEFAECGGLVFVDGTDHAALRFTDASGHPGGGGLGLQSWRGGTVSHVVLFRNRIHHMGDVHAPFDQDRHGIAIGARVSHAWVLENELYRNSGDGIQINAGSAALQPLTHHIYIGRNVAYQNKQAGFWVKQATDVIFSENHAFQHRPSNSSLGACMGGQYAPDHVWFINNAVWECDYGIQIASDSGLGIGRNHFVIGNIIAFIHDSDGGFTPTSAWQNCAISLMGGTTRYVLQNSLYDVDAGVCVSGGSGVVHLYDNLIQQVRADGHHLVVDSHSVARASAASRGNLFAPDYRLWLAGERMAFAAGNRGSNGNAVVHDVGWVDAAGRDFRLAPGSPAIDAGVMQELPVWAYFNARYHLSIGRDILGTPRPSGQRSDIGAFEYPW